MNAGRDKNTPPPCNERRRWPSILVAFEELMIDGLILRSFFVNGTYQSKVAYLVQMTIISATMSVFLWFQIHTGWISTSSRSLPEEPKCSPSFPFLGLYGSIESSSHRKLHISAIWRYHKHLLPPCLSDRVYLLESAIYDLGQSRTAANDFLRRVPGEQSLQ